MNEPYMKRCPFCGGRSAAACASSGEYLVACCREVCRAEGPRCHTQQRAIEVWNMRAHEGETND